MTDSTDKLLAERGKTHGDFTIYATITQALKSIVQGHSANLSSIQQEAIDMILHKIGRICAGNPNYRDHWDDIAGYARLVSERIPLTKTDKEISF